MQRLWVHQRSEPNQALLHLLLLLDSVNIDELCFVLSVSILKRYSDLAEV